MIRVAAALTCALVTSLPAAAMVGGAQPTTEGAGRAVVMLTGSRGTFCSVSRSDAIVLTAARACCRAPHKLIDFDAARGRCSDMRTSRAIPTSA